MVSFNKLAIASEFECLECEIFKDVYQDTKYLDHLGYLKESIEFTEMLLIDFKQHIKDKHLDRYNAFLKGVKND